MPLRISEEYIAPIQEDLNRYFYEFYWQAIIEAAELNTPQRLFNQPSPALIEAIRAGRVHYENGVFTGTFDARISRELRRFATFDRRTKTWKGDPPSLVKGIAAAAREDGRRLAQRIEDLIADIPARVSAEIDRLQYSIDEPLFAMSAQADQDLRSLGIDLQITPQLAERLKKEYTTNQNLNIKNWTPDQTLRLRDMIKRNALRGYNRAELQEMIASEFEVTMNKARFLARQETSLFLASVRDARYSDGGIRIVQWMTSNDVRVVGNPAGLYPNPTEGHGNHFALAGKFCLLSDPTLYADTLDDARAGRWKSKAMINAGTSHAGTEWACRCTYRPVLG